MLGPFEKQPSEEIRVGIDFTDRLATGDACTDVYDLAVTDSDGVDVTTTLSRDDSRDGNTISVVIEGGVDGSNYILSILVTTANADIINGNLLIMIREE